MLLTTLNTVEHYRETFLLQHSRINKEVRDVHVPASTHNIFVQVPVWPCNNCTVRATVLPKSDNPALILREGYVKRECGSRFPDLCIESVYFANAHQAPQETLSQPVLGSN